MLRIINVVGARPNFMKIAPLVAEMGQYRDIESILVHTGQHYDDNLSRVFFEELGIPRADLNLGVGSGPREQQIQRISEAFRPVVSEHPADAVLVVGDVNSTIACATVAREHGIKVVHVEAGLRSFDLDMPEEHNRRETDEIADYLFVTERAGMLNLEKERVVGKPFLVGNVMIDTLVRNLERVEQSDILDRLDIRPGRYFASTFHRPSNVDSAADLRALVALIEEIGQRTTLVLPLHPRTQSSLIEHRELDRLRGAPGVRLIEPLGYLDFLRLVRDAGGVITDSGGIQEETTYLGVPCLTMRENTERPVTIELGTNVLIGADGSKLMDQVDEIIAGRFKQGTIPPHWDGRAAQRIVATLHEELSEPAT